MNLDSLPVDSSNVRRVLQEKGFSRRRSVRVISPSGVRREKRLNFRVAIRGRVDDVCSSLDGHLSVGSGNNGACGKQGASVEDYGDGSAGNGRIREYGSWIRKQVRSGVNPVPELDELSRAPVDCLDARDCQRVDALGVAGGSRPEVDVRVVRSIGRGWAEEPGVDGRPHHVVDVHVVAHDLSSASQRESRLRSRRGVSDNRFSWRRDDGERVHGLRR